MTATGRGCPTILLVLKRMKEPIVKRTQKAIVLAVCALVSVAAYVSAQPPAEPPPETAQALEVLGRARQEAMQFSIRRNEDLSEKGDVLLEIAALYRDLGDNVSAAKLLERADRLCEQSGVWRRRANLAMAQAKAGLEEEALRTLATLPAEDPDTARQTFKDEALLVIIGHRLRRNDFDAALAAAARMRRTGRVATGHHPRDNAYKQIVLKQWQQGNVAAARKNIKLVALPWIRDELLQELISMQLAKDDVEGPLELVRMIRYYPSHKIRSLIKIAVVQAKRGDRAGAEKSFQKATAAAIAWEKAPYFDMRGYAMRWSAFCDIAAAQAQAGDPGATKTLTRVVEAVEGPVLGGAAGDMLRGHLATAQVKCGLIKEAVKTVEAIEKLPTKSLAFASIAAAAAEAGERTAAEANRQRAVKTAQSIADSGLRDRTIRALVSKCVEAGQLALGAQLAEKIGVKYEKYGERDGALLEVLEAYAQRQEVEQALAVQAKMNIPHLRRRANQSMAEAKIRAGDLAGAVALLKATEEEGGGNEIPKLMQTVVQAQIKAGDFSGAAAAARFVRWVGYTDRALRDVAAAQARSGDLQGALALVSDRDYGERKAYIWLGAARGLAERSRKKLPAGV